MHACYHLTRMGVRMIFGPGRHPTSGATFLYFEGPDAMVCEYSSGVRSISPEQEAGHQPRRFPTSNNSRATAPARIVPLRRCQA